MDQWLSRNHASQPCPLGTVTDFVKSLIQAKVSCGSNIFFSYQHSILMQTGDAFLDVTCFDWTQAGSFLKAVWLSVEGRGFPPPVIFSLYLSHFFCKLGYESIYSLLAPVYVSKQRETNISRVPKMCYMPMPSTFTAVSAVPWGGPCKVPAPSRQGHVHLNNLP